MELDFFEKSTEELIRYIWYSLQMKCHFSVGLYLF